MTRARSEAGADELRARLLGPRRHEVLGLDDILEVGRVLHGGPDGMSFYGLTPARWYERGIRLLGRTCVEATPDRTAGPIAETTSALIGQADGVGVVDLFAGSGNLMTHVARALSAQACGMEADPAVWQHTDANLRIMATPATVRLGDWLSYFDDPLDVETVVYVLSPPWAGAFSFATGLDLARTEPPVPLIVRTLAERDRSRHCYAVVQHTPTEPVLNVASLTDGYQLLGLGQGCIVLRVR